MDPAKKHNCINIYCTVFLSNQLYDELILTYDNFIYMFVNYLRLNVVIMPSKIQGNTQLHVIYNNWVLSFQIPGDMSHYI